MVGLKPSFGRVPPWPLGTFADVAVLGPLIRTVRDSALLLNVLARLDLRDPFCLPPDSCSTPRDWRDGIEDGLAGLRIAVLRQPAIPVPMGFAANALPRAVPLAAGLYRDDLVLRGARTLELAQPFAVAKQ